MAELGAVLVNLSFGSFGERRGAAWQDEPLTADWGMIGATTRRGFTGHEHLDSVNLIHMNGRVYDPWLGQFLSADPVDGNVHLSQRLNRYSYVMNSPHVYTDPSGFSPWCADDRGRLNSVQISFSSLPSSRGSGCHGDNCITIGQRVEWTNEKAFSWFYDNRVPINAARIADKWTIGVGELERSSNIEEITVTAPPIDPALRPAIEQAIGMVGQRMRQIEAGEWGGGPGWRGLPLGVVIEQRTSFIDKILRRHGQYYISTQHPNPDIAQHGFDHGRGVEVGHFKRVRAAAVVIGMPGRRTPDTLREAAMRGRQRSEDFYGAPVIIFFPGAPREGARIYDATGTDYPY